MTQFVTDGPVSTNPHHRPPTAPPPLSSGRPVRAVRSGLAKMTPDPEPSDATPQTAQAAVAEPMNASSPTGTGDPKPAAAKASRPGPALDRDQILAVTAECLDEVGLEKTTIRSIAKRLNCAVGSIYRYYTDKHELLEAVCEQRFVEVADAIQAGADPDTTLRLYHAAASARPEQYRLMFWLASVGRSPEQPAQLPSIIATVVAGWARQLEDANAARCRWALLHGQLMLDADLDCELLPSLTEPKPTSEPLPENA
ncbi:MAG: TetR family transcriptional regulator [Planctomycetota bacterium]